MELDYLGWFSERVERQVTLSRVSGAGVLMAGVALIQLSYTPAKAELAAS